MAVTPQQNANHVAGFHETHKFSAA